MKDIVKAIAHFRYGIKCDIFSEPVTTYAKTAVAALEKQIPQKPREEIVIANTLKFRYCPACSVRFIQYGMKYCGECGQALDWGEAVQEG